jgi:outer membrane protein TolC
MHDTASLSRSSPARPRVMRTGVASAVFATLWLATSPPCASAQGTTATLPSPLTLDDALRFAADHYPSLRVAVEAITAATANVEVTRTAYLPRLDALWQSNRGTVNNITGPLLPQAVVPPISGPPLATTSASSVWGSAAGMLLTWEPFDLGLRGASVQEAEAAVTRARAGQALTRLQVQQAVGAAYLSVMAARQAAVAAGADVARREVLARTARTLADAQLRPGAEAARAEAERAAAHTRLIQARQTVLVAEALLSRTLGTDLAPTLAEHQALLTRLPADTPAAADTTTHPLLQVQQAAVDLAASRDAVLAASFRPRFLLQGSTSARGSGAGPDGGLEGGTSGLWLDRVNWAAGVQVVFPNLFDVVGIRARRQAATATARAEQARLDEQRLALTAEQRAAEAFVQAAREIARNMPVQLEAARTSEAQARARFEAGLASIVEVADSQALLATAEYQEAASRVDVWRALLGRAVAFDTMDAFIALVRGRE